MDQENTSVLSFPPLNPSTVERSNASFTPEPWTFRSDFYDNGLPYVVFQSGDGFYRRKTQLGFSLSGICSLEDARLMVSAPGLLKALKSALVFIERNGSSHDAELYRECAAAIARATGSV